MKLLFVTQVVDRNDSVLGTYHQWISELAERFEHIEVICLYEGEHQLPANVRVHSLGKEKMSRRAGFLRRLVYAARFKRLAWKLRHDYDSVFVHMNQEYILIDGPMWKLLGKPIYMWRNHYAGSILTDIAAAFCTKVFCTSRFSYTAKYKRTVLMPVGVDTKRFHPDPAIIRKPNSILFLARMSPSKNPLLLLEALRELSERNVPFTTTFVGSPTPKHEAYYRSLIERAEHYGLSDRVAFLPAIPNREAPDFYRAHEIFVNTSRSGMFDKTMLEALASGCVVVSPSRDLASMTGTDSFFTTRTELTDCLGRVLAMPVSERNGLAKEDTAKVFPYHSLTSLAGLLTREMRS